MLHFRHRISTVNDTTIQSVGEHESLCKPYLLTSDLLPLMKERVARVADDDPPVNVEAHFEKYSLLLTSYGHFTNNFLKTQIVHFVDTIGGAVVVVVRMLVLEDYV